MLFAFLFAIQLSSHELDLFLTRIRSFAMSEGKTTVNSYLKKEKTKKHDGTISRGSGRD